MYLTCSTVWQNIYRHPGSEKLTMSWRAKLWLTCTCCCNDFARKELQHMWPGACQSLCFLWQFLVCKVASNAEQRTFGISEVCLLALGVYTPQPQKVSVPCLYNRSCLQSSWLLQEHSLVADRHCSAKCFHVALGGFWQWPASTGYFRRRTVASQASKQNCCERKLLSFPMFSLFWHAGNHQEYGEGSLIASRRCLKCYEQSKH